MTRISQQPEQKEVAEKLAAVHKAVLNYSMKKKMQESNS
jgi:hypothetical protein